jgi:hypothetical protein
LADKGGAAQISTATQVLAEIIASDAGNSHASGSRAETSASVCHAECMANKQPKPSVKTTEWRIGQPLDSPQVHSGPLREAVNEPMRGQTGFKRQKHKKK